LAKGGEPVAVAGSDIDHEDRSKEIVESESDGFENDIVDPIDMADAPVDDDGGVDVGQDDDY
jgi:hypothetical protein